MQEPQWNAYENGDKHEQCSHAYSQEEVSDGLEYVDCMRQKVTQNLNILQLFQYLPASAEARTQLWIDVSLSLLTRNEASSSADLMK